MWARRHRDHLTFIPSLAAKEKEGHGLEGESVCVRARRHRDHLTFSPSMAAKEKEGHGLEGGEKSEAINNDSAGAAFILDIGQRERKTRGYLNPRPQTTSPEASTPIPNP